MTMLAKTISILLVEDDPDYVELIQEMLQQHGKLDFRLQRADRLSHCLERLEEGEYHILLLDLGLPDSLGLDTLEAVLPAAGEIPIIVLTGLDDETVGMKAVQIGAQDFVLKSEISGPLLSRAILYAMERKRAELSVEWEREYFRSFVQSMNDWVWEMNLKGEYTYSNLATETILGYTSEEVVGKTVAQFWPGDGSATQQHEDFVAKLETGKSWKNLPCRFLHKNGSEVYLESNGLPIRNSLGELIGYRGVDRDITARKEAENEIRNKEVNLSALINAISEAAFLMDADGTILAANSELARRVRRDVEEVVGKCAYELVPSEVGAYRKKKVEEVLETGEPIQFEDTREGRIIFNSIYPIKDSFGRVSRVAVFGYDITERKAADLELKSKNAQLETANKQMSEFVSIVSHDFGNPLGIIQASVELMLLGAYGELNPKIKEKAESIFATVQRMNKLRTDTLELSRMDLGKFKLNRQEGELCSLISRVVEQMMVPAGEKDQTISVLCQDPVSLNYDPDYLFRVLENYLSNAIRYSEPGKEIRLGVEAADDAVTVWVKDQGRGIPSGELENVFLRFYRTGKRVPGSSGLGLSIVKGIVEAHHGRVWAESLGEGKGATFFFTLPK